MRIRSAADAVDWSEVFPLAAPVSESVGWSVDMSVVDGLGSMSLPSILCSRSSVKFESSSIP